jgi:predicted signal transduction protein with EAL and GGDEF domain
MIASPFCRPATGRSIPAQGGLGAAEVSDVERRFELINRSLRSAVGAGISVGLAALAGGETLDDVLARADAALLATKQARGA